MLKERTLETCCQTRLPPTALCNRFSAKYLRICVSTSAVYSVLFLAPRDFFGKILGDEGAKLGSFRPLGESV